MATNGNKYEMFLFNFARGNQSAIRNQYTIVLDFLCYNKLKWTLE